MTEPRPKAGFMSPPCKADSWVRSPDRATIPMPVADLYAARLTVDITPALRGRIKVAAFQRGQIVADMLRTLLAREFPDTDGGKS